MTRFRYLAAAFPVAGTLAALALAGPGTSETSEPALAPSETKVSAALRAGRVYTEIAHLPLATYAQISDEIVHARVRTLVPVASDGEPPHTEVHLELMDVMKGAPPSELVVVVGGATIEGAADLRVPAAPVFEVWEEVVLFLCGPDEKGRRGIVGLRQGTYRVDASQGDMRSVHGLHTRQREMLPAFKARIASLVGEAVQKGESR